MSELSTDPRRRGDALFAAGQYRAAIDAYREALRQDPGNFAVQHNLGVAQMDAGDLAQAEASLQTAAALDPRALVAQLSLGELYLRSQRFGDAERAFSAALALEKNSFAAENGLGNALRRQGRHPEAVAAYQRALALDARSPAAQFNCAVSLQQLGRIREALAVYQKLIQAVPHLAEAHANIGFLNNELGQPGDAILASQQALSLNAELGPAWCNLGLAQQAVGQLDSAIHSFRRAIQINPRDVASHSNLLYALNFHPDSTDEALFEEHRRWAAVHADPLFPARPGAPSDRSPTRRLRVGYVSAHFREHAVNSFVEPVLAAHDKQQCEVFCYSDVAQAQQDAATARLQSTVDHWRDISHASDEGLASRIAQDEIDILVDLAGHIGGNRLLAFARKPAPIQVTYLGYQNTTGMRAFDYRLTDSWSDPPGVTDRFHTERLARLDPLFYCYRPGAEAPPVSPLPAARTGVVTFGSLNFFAKVTPTVLASWAQLLSVVPNSRLLMLVPRSAELEQRVRQVFAGRGIDPGRLEFAPRAAYAEYLRTIQRVDVALDAFPFNGHTTACDCLWLGVPVVMLAGHNYVSRFGTGALVQLGLQDWIARTPEEYVAIAAQKAGSLEALARLRAELREKMSVSPILDAGSFARRLEAAYRAMWRAYLGLGAGEGR